MSNLSRRLLLATALALTAASASAAEADRQAYFGDLHLHTGLSYDAWGMFGVKIMPDEAYRFARGEPISYLGRTVRRAEPLDFLAVTDHSEFLGVLNQLDDAASAAAGSETGRRILAKKALGFTTLARAAFEGMPVPKELDADKGARSGWAKEIEAANANYKPGKFTTFIAYEWTSMPGSGAYNLHRNVIFLGDHAPMPFSAADSLRPEDLWTYLEKVRAEGTPVLAIPHNSNASGGFMFDWVTSEGKPIDAAYARRRAANEPLVEIVQTKGTSETVPELSANDEFADFELFDRLLVNTDAYSSPHGSYVREALGRGLVLASRTGVNPYKMGMVGATDIHNGLSTSREDAFAGGSFGIDPAAMLPDRDAAQAALNAKPGVIRSNQFGSGGLTGAWAEQNNRESLFAALQRKETFATSGPRIKARLFAGWSYPKTLLRDRNWVKAAYRQGVPQGADLAPAAGPAKRPSFVLWAAKDPSGANLERLQMVKVWLDGADYQEEVIDVLRAQTVAGQAELAALWEDDSFDAATPAAYYLRVLEVPTPRWSTLLARKTGATRPDTLPELIRERAWTSPIWYTAGK